VSAEAPSAGQADATIRSRRYAVLLIVVALIGVVVSLATRCFLEGIYQIQQELYVHLPHAVGYPGPPKWWPRPVLALGALLAGWPSRGCPATAVTSPPRGWTGWFVRPVRRCSREWSWRASVVHVTLLLALSRGSVRLRLPYSRIL